jgi:hypothetical protein
MWEMKTGKIEFVQSCRFVLVISGNEYEVSRISGIGIGHGMQQGGCIYNNVIIESAMKKDKEGDIFKSLFYVFREYFSGNNFDIKLYFINIDGGKENFSFLLQGCRMLNYFVSDIDVANNGCILENIEVIPSGLFLMSEKDE